MRQVFLLSVLFLLPASAPASELGLSVGFRTGGTESGTFETRDGEAVSLVLDVPINKKLMFEVFLSHQSGKFEIPLSVLIRIGLVPGFELPRFDLTHLHFGVLRQWNLRRVSPFTVVGLGVAQLESAELIDEDSFSASVAGGVKFTLNKRLGARLEVRGYWADISQRFYEDAFQLELSSGLTFRL